METTIMENQMEKKMENEMEYIGVIYYSSYICRPCESLTKIADQAACSRDALPYADGAWRGLCRFRHPHNFLTALTCVTGFGGSWQWVSLVEPRFCYPRIRRHFGRYG